MSLTSPDIVIQRVPSNGLEFEVWTTGPLNGKLAILLHGFPEHPISWLDCVPMFVQAGYRVWIPALRGYGTSSKPAGVSEYDVDKLVDDVAGLYDAAHDEQEVTETVLVGHDWGTVVAYNFAMLKSRPLTKLIVMNGPHPACMGRELAKNWEQKKRSYYMMLFQFPWVPEWFFTRNHARMAVDVIINSSVHPERFNDQFRRALIRQALEPGRMTAMLNWYRASFRSSLFGRKSRAHQQRFPVIEIPTLLIWGRPDHALCEELTNGMNRYASQLELKFIDNASHWVQQDATEEVNQAMKEFLSKSVIVKAKL